MNSGCFTDIYSALARLFCIVLFIFPYKFVVVLFVKGVNSFADCVDSCCFSHVRFSSVHLSLRTSSLCGLYYLSGYCGCAQHYFLNQQQQFGWSLALLCHWHALPRWSFWIVPWIYASKCSSLFVHLLPACSALCFSSMVSNYFSSSLSYQGMSIFASQ